MFVQWLKHIHTQCFLKWGDHLIFQLWIRCLILIRTNSLALALGYGRKDYEVVEFDDFLSAEECDLIIEEAKKRELQQSTISNDKGIHMVDLERRRSKQCWLTSGDHWIVQRISQKICSYIPLPESHQEDLQVVRYTEREYYRIHFDTPYQQKVIDRFNRFCGPRVATFLIYLNDDFEGGETEFILARKLITPKKGKAILFYNVDINLSLIPESIHVGKEVVQGTKWIANKWIRVFPFRPASDICITQHHDIPWMMKLVQGKSGQM